MGYVVNNCPGIYKSGNKPALCVENNYRCDLVEVCLIKKIIKVCQAVESHNVKCSGSKLAESILEKFDMEEVG